MNGAKYEGSWKRDNREGYGLLILPDQTFYEGEFSSDLVIGRGVLVRRQMYKDDDNHSWDLPTDKETKKLNYLRRAQLQSTDVVWIPTKPSALEGVVPEEIYSQLLDGHW
jgi:hypothetical protein